MGMENMTKNIETNVFKNILNVKSRTDFRNWLLKNCNIENECWAVVKAGKPIDDDGNLYYIHAVYEAMCFGWIDSVKKKIDNCVYQRFSPRKKNSHWSELNKARFLFLKDKGLMTECGLKESPSFNFKIDDDFEKMIKSDEILFENFKHFPNLYKRIRICNIQQAKKNRQIFIKALNNFLQQTKKGKMYGNWDDYGVLQSYKDDPNFNFLF